MSWQMDGSFKSAMWYLIQKFLTQMQYLLSWIEETTVWSLEFTLTNKCTILGLHTLRKTSWLTWCEAERIDSVGTCEEIGVSWIFLNIFPSSMRPSAWHKLKIFLRDSCSALNGLWVVCVTAWSKRPAPSLISSAVIEHVVALIVGFLHFY